jgi:hypothetical protein
VEKIIKYSLFLRQCKVYQPAQSQRKKGAKKNNNNNLLGVVGIGYNPNFVYPKVLEFN